MNSIEAQPYQDKRVSKEPYLQIFIDDKNFVHSLNEYRPNSIMEVLIPTFSDLLYDKDERHILHKRMIDTSGKTVNLPILMCPDDCDFWCTIIIAECEVRDDYVFWHRIGSDRSDICGDFSPKLIGKKVEWFNSFGPYQFERDKYFKFLDSFKFKP